MFIVGLLGWWYVSGWRKVGVILLEKLANTEDFLSIDQLIGSLFAPFKQISATTSRQGTFQDKVREWFDKQFSRIFGFIIRSLLILLGLIWLLIQTLVGLIIFLVWPMLPLLPIIGFILMFSGWIPWTL